jgi:hypothetical protein
VTRITEFGEGQLSGYWLSSMSPLAFEEHYMHSYILGFLFEYPFPAGCLAGSGSRTLLESGSSHVQSRAVPVDEIFVTSHDSRLKSGWLFIT